MKTLIIILSVLTFTNCSQDQNWEDNVCKCIEANYNENGWNYFNELSSFEKELITRSKIDKTIESKLKLLVELSKKEYVNFYKHQFSERLQTFGRETTNYCIRRELFNEDCKERHWSEKLITQLKIHRNELSINSDRTKYNQNIAKSLIEIVENIEGDDKLKNLILLQILYERIPDEASYTLDQLEIESMQNQKEYDEFDKTRITEIYINHQNQILIKNQQIQLSQICVSLQELLNQNMGLEIVADKKSNFKYCLDVNDEVKNCLTNRKNEDSINLFEKEYSELTESEKKEFQTIHGYQLLKSRMK